MYEFTYWSKLNVHIWWVGQGTALAPCVDEHHPKPRRRKWLTRHYARVLVGKRRNIPHLLHLPHPVWVWEV